MALRWLNKLSPKVDSTSREVVGVWYVILSCLSAVVIHVIKDGWQDVRGDC